MNVCLRPLFLAIVLFASLYHTVNSTCSKICVHFEGASSLNIDAKDSFCQSGIYSGKDYYIRESGSTGNMYLFFDRRDNSWSVGSILGSTTVKALVYDTAEDPTDISSTWKTGHASDTYRPSDVESVAEAIPNEKIKVKCGKYDNTRFTVGASVGVSLGFIVILVGLALCCRRNKPPSQSRPRQIEIVRNSREDTAAGRRRRNLASVHTNVVLPPSYEESTREGAPPYTLSNTTGASNNTDSLDNTDLPTSCDASSNVTACPRVATNGSGLMIAAGPSDEATENVSTVFDRVSCDVNTGVSCAGDNIPSAEVDGTCSSSVAGGMTLHPPATQLESSDAQDRRSEHTVIAVGVSEDTRTATSSDTQLLIA